MVAIRINKWSKPASTNPDHRLVRSGPMIIVTFALAAFWSEASIAADKLLIRCESKSYFLYEPLILDVTLKLGDDGYLDSNDSASLVRRDRSLGRRLRAQLRTPEKTLCEAFLGGGAFAYDPNAPRESHATLLGCLGNKEIKRTEAAFSFWSLPGTYSLVVVDVDSGLESNEINITLRQPPDAAAAQLFASRGAETIRFLLEPDSVEDVNAFEELATDHADSIYGRYAKACLALRRFHEVGRSGNAGAGRANLDALDGALNDSARAFAVGHPIRNRLLLASVRTSLRRGNNDTAPPALGVLLAECRDSAILKEAKSLAGVVEKSRNAIGE